MGFGQVEGNLQSQMDLCQGCSKSVRTIARYLWARQLTGSALRHIRLINTPEQKPITNSRDTQELHYEAGCEVLQIFLDHQTKSKTSLLQDFAYYEVSHRYTRKYPLLTISANVCQTRSIAGTRSSTRTSISSPDSASYASTIPTANANAYADGSRGNDTTRPIYSGSIPIIQHVQ